MRRQWRLLHLRLGRFSLMAAICLFSLIVQQASAAEDCNFKLLKGSQLDAALDELAALRRDLDLLTDNQEKSFALDEYKTKHDGLKAALGDDVFTREFSQRLDRLAQVNNQERQHERQTRDAEREVLIPIRVYVHKGKGKVIAQLDKSYIANANFLAVERSGSIGTYNYRLMAEGSGVNNSHDKKVGISADRKWIVMASPHRITVEDFDGKASGFIERIKTHDYSSIYITKDNATAVLVTDKPELIVADLKGHTIEMDHDGMFGKFTNISESASGRYILASRGDHSLLWDRTDKKFVDLNPISASFSIKSAFFRPQSDQILVETTRAVFGVHDFFIYDIPTGQYERRIPSVILNLYAVSADGRFVVSIDTTNKQEPIEVWDIDTSVRKVVPSDALPNAKELIIGQGRNPGEMYLLDNSKAPGIAKFRLIDLTKLSLATYELKELSQKVTSAYGFSRDGKSFFMNADGEKDGAEDILELEL